MEKLAQIIKSKNLKVTPQRLAIYNVLYNSIEHPSAEHIFKALHDAHPTMSLATVYKTLDVFKKSELVQELSPSGDVYRYDANIGTHPHAICMECGKLIDLHTNLFDNVVEKMQEETDFSILNEKIYFYGICSDCKSKSDEA